MCILHIRHDQTYAIQTNNENVNFLKNGFYHRVQEASEYGKSEGKRSEQLSYIAVLDHLKCNFNTSFKFDAVGSANGSLQRKRRAVK